MDILSGFPMVSTSILYKAWRGQDFGGIEGGPAETEVTWMTRG